MKIKKGGKVSKWNTTRRKLKQEFFEKGITRCELCGTDNGLSFAHRVKRRFIPDGDPELFQVALLCIPDHAIYERMSHADMFKGISEIIENRNIWKKFKLH